jgi:hydroxyethylthiazole kinase-like uncharacterized protein yjeF
MRGIHYVQQVREAELAAMAVSSAETLMERASYGIHIVIAETLREEYGRVSGSTVLGLIGSGNNGGDALWALALLARRGVKVQAVDVTGSRKITSADTRFESAGGQWIPFDEVVEHAHEYHVVVDGITGIGAARAIPQDVVQFLNTNHFIVIAVDVPSGFDVDRGIPFDDDCAVEADITVACGALKPCHLVDPGADYVGELHFVSIGLEDFLEEPSLWLMSDEDAAHIVRPYLSVNSHKYSRGTVAVVAGSQKFLGAGILATRAARWGGAGLIHQVGGVFEPELASIIYHPRTGTDVRADAWLVGPGLTKKVKQQTKRALRTTGTVVLDAASVRAVADSTKLQTLVRERLGLTVLTPHAGEFTYLARGYGIQLSGSPMQDAIQLAGVSGCTIYLKGSIGIIATPSGEVVVTQRTTEHLSTAGSGDVLAGFLASLAAHHRPATHFELAQLVGAAVVIHSRAAEIIAIDGEPVIADEIEAQLPVAIADLA